METEIVPGIYRIEQRLGPRYLFQYVLPGERSLLLDTGIASSPAEHISPALQSIGITSDHPLTVLLTHADVDHCGGNAPLKGLLPQAQLMAHRADQPWIESKERILAERYGWYAAYDVDYDPATKAWLADNLATDIPLDRTVEDEEWFDLGDRRVQFLHVPGHSPGHMAVWDPQTRTALIADAVLERGLYAVAGQRIGPPPYFNVAAYRATITRLQQLAPLHLLTAHYPALHGEEVTRFLATSHAFIGEMEQAVEAVLAEAGQAVPLRTLTAQVDARVGPFVAFQNELAGSVRAHVETLTQAGRAKQVSVADRPAWHLVRAW